MKNVSLLFVTTSIVSISFINACKQPDTQATVATSGEAKQIAMIERGSYLVNAMGCDDCHTPKRLGPYGVEIIPELRLSGFPQGGKLPPNDSSASKNGWILFSPDLTAAVGPWGTSFAANLTLDETGIGNWKEEQFLYALRNGKWKGLPDSRPLLPPMPWEAYKNLDDDDLKAIFAYLKTIKPVRNIVPPPSLPGT